MIFCMCISLSLALFVYVCARSEYFEHLQIYRKCLQLRVWCVCAFAFSRMRLGLQGAEFLIFFCAIAVVRYLLLREGCFDGGNVKG